MDLDSGLQRFGLAHFRPGQREAMEELLNGGRALLVAPTGGGKSLVYQLPAALFEGTSVIISPLVSLMHDQVGSLEDVGVPATFLAATLEPETLRERTRAIANGEYKLVYVAPERLSFPGFRNLLANLDCPLIAVDEAHCISEWGHDFRPDYLQIGRVLDEIRPARVLACTATATPVVRDEILSRLGLPADTPQLVHGFARPNLALRANEVASSKERGHIVDATLLEAIGAPNGAKGCAIVYAPTRKSTESEAGRLGRRGYRTEAYHAGLRGDVRERVSESFRSGETEIVVATNAFGMGIDRSDVRAVVHLAPPSSIEAYYQEVGRAGRDGDPAIGQLLTAAGDMPLRRRLIEGDSDGRASGEDVIQHKWNLFLELMRWTEGGSCRHDAILRYFGDEAETLAGCGRCDVCREQVQQSQVDEETATLTVRKALSAVARVHGRFGLQAAAKLLRGASDARLESAGLHLTPTWGALGDHPDVWLTRLLRRCVTAGWVDFVGGDRPVVVLTEEGAAVMRGEAPARLLLPVGIRSLPKTAPVTVDRGARGESEAPLDAASEALFNALRQHRLEVSQRLGTPPYVVASDRTLREIARLRPESEEALRLIHGIGPAKAKRFGEGLLQIVREQAQVGEPTS